MKILHITPESNGYEEVTLLANRYSENNHLAVIEKDGKQFITGGFLIEDNSINRTWLDKVAKEKQYGFIKSLREIPFVKAYFESK